MVVKLNWGLYESRMDIIVLCATIVPSAVFYWDLMVVVFFLVHKVGVTYSPSPLYPLSSLAYGPIEP